MLPRARLTRSNENTTSHTFDNTDAKGRKHGVEIVTFDASFKEIDESTPYYTYWRHEPGEFFGLHLQATKDGKAWGASQRTQIFNTKEERAAAIEKRMQAARKK